MPPTVQPGNPLDTRGSEDRPPGRGGRLLQAFLPLVTACRLANPPDLRACVAAGESARADGGEGVALVAEGTRGFAAASGV